MAQNIWFDRKLAEKLQGEPVDSDRRAVMKGRLAATEVLRGLGQLSPEHRVLIALVCVDDLTYTEAAEILGVPVGTVMSRLARGRLALHDAVH
jgi:RNA polymerase sigma-70 factor (ECF subfamily)